MAVPRGISEMAAWPRPRRTGSATCCWRALRVDGESDADVVAGAVTDGTHLKLHGRTQLIAVHDLVVELVRDRDRIGEDDRGRRRRCWAGWRCRLGEGRSVGRAHAEHAGQCNDEYGDGREATLHQFPPERQTGLPGSFRHWASVVGC